MASSTTIGALEGFHALPVFKQMFILVGIAASVAMGFYIVLWSQEPDYAPLFGNLNHKDAGEIVEALERSGIPYKLDGGSGVLLVESSKVHEARIELAQQGMQAGLGTGFEILDKDSSFGTSQFIERTRYIRALQGELERTISSMHNVKSARVHLAIPKQSSFMRHKRKPGASVFLELQGGFALEQSQAAAIVNLVASGVQGLTPDNVTVVDQSGRLLSSLGGDKLAMAAKQLDYKTQLENVYADRISNLLSAILGEGRVTAEVTADVDFTSNERTYESYDPQKGALRSEQTFDINSGSGSTVGGVPGSLSNVPPRDTTTTRPEDVIVGDEDSPQPTQVSNGNSKRQAIRNFELDRTIGHERTAPGKLLKLSVAVVVDDKVSYSNSGKETRTPLGEDELKNIEKLVKDSIGFDNARGDTVTVINSSFAQPAPVAALAPVPFYKQAWFPGVVKQSLAGLFLLILVFVVLKPMLKGLTNVSAMEKSHAAKLKELEGAMAGGAGYVGGSAANNQLQDISRVKSLVQDDPKRVAQVVKNMVGTDDG